MHKELRYFIPILTNGSVCEQGWHFVPLLTNERNGIRVVILRARRYTAISAIFLLTWEALQNVTGYLTGRFSQAGAALRSGLRESLMSLLILKRLSG